MLPFSGGEKIVLVRGRTSEPRTNACVKWFQLAQPSVPRGESPHGAGRERLNSSVGVPRYLRFSLSKFLHHQAAGPTRPARLIVCLTRDLIPPLVHCLG